MTETTTTTSQISLLRGELEQALSERGVVSSLHLLDDFEDKELLYVARVVAHFDAIEGSKSGGLLVHLLRERFQPPSLDETAESDEEKKARVRRERHERDVRWAERNGFTRAQAPFAASARRVLAMLGNEAPSAASVRARVSAQHPHLFEETP